MDRKIFELFHSLSGFHWLIDGFFIFLAQYLPYILAAGLLFLIFTTYRKWHDRLYFLFLSVLSFLIAKGFIVEVIRFFYIRPRPFITLGIDPLINPPLSSSMPSGHATVFFMIAALALFIERRYFWYFLGGAVLVGFGRILVGVHWPSDILVGAAIGIVSVFLARALLSEERKGL